MVVEITAGASAGSIEPPAGSLALTTRGIGGRSGPHVLRPLLGKPYALTRGAVGYFRVPFAPDVGEPMEVELRVVDPDVDLRGRPWEVAQVVLVYPDGTRLDFVPRVLVRGGGGGAGGSNGTSHHQYQYQGHQYQYRDEEGWLVEPAKSVTLQRPPPAHAAAHLRDQNASR